MKKKKKNDALKFLMSCAHMSPQQEQVLAPASDPVRQRPADILVPGEPTPDCIDIAVTNPLQPKFLQQAAVTPGHACETYAQEVKVDRFAAGVETLGYRYTAAVVETYGRWNKAGARIVRKTIHALAAAKHISKSAASIRVNQRLSCALWRNNARAVLDRLPELCDLQAPLEE